MSDNSNSLKAHLKKMHNQFGYEKLTQYASIERQVTHHFKRPTNEIEMMVNP